MGTPGVGSPGVLLLRTASSNTAWIGTAASIAEPLGARRVIEDSVGRVGYCGICRDPFCVCQECDHGQRFCPAHLFKHRRAEHVDAARERYAKSLEGREKARLRQARRRMREYCKARGLSVPKWAEIRPGPRPPSPSSRRTSVTDTASPSDGSSEKVSPSVTESVSSTKTGHRPWEQRLEPPRSSGSEMKPCSFCGRPCGPFIRFEPKGRSPSTRPFRRGRTAASSGALVLPRPL